MGVPTIGDLTGLNAEFCVIESTGKEVKMLLLFSKLGTICPTDD